MAKPRKRAASGAAAMRLGRYTASIRHGLDLKLGPGREASREILGFLHAQGSRNLTYSLQDRLPDHGPGEYLSVHPQLHHATDIPERELGELVRRVRRESEAHERLAGALVIGQLSLRDIEHERLSRSRCDLQDRRSAQHTSEQEVSCAEP